MRPTRVITIDANKRPDKDSNLKSNVRVVMSTSCSTIVFAAADEGMSGINMETQTRHEATLDCVDLMSKENNITHADLPLIFPPPLFLEALLEKSLAFEKKKCSQYLFEKKNKVLFHEKRF